MSGCMSACEKEKYKLHFDSENVKNLNQAQHSDIEATFTIKETTYVQVEQYAISDFISFLAEIGGFMGLVLGTSMLGMYEELNALVGRLHYLPYRQNIPWGVFV